MRTITITAWKRPDSLRSVLDALSVNNLHGYKLLINVEPGNFGTLRVAHTAKDFIDCEVVLNQVHLGISQNPYNALTHVFCAGSTANIYLEEDVIVSPDATRMANWYFDMVDKTDLLCMNLMGERDKSGRQKSDPSLMDDLFLSHQFNALGLCMTRAQWQIFQQHWNQDRRGWDWSMIALLERTPDLHVLMPRFARSMHISPGTHVRAAEQKQRFEGVPFNQGIDLFKYRIV